MTRRTSSGPVAFDPAACVTAGLPALWLLLLLLRKRGYAYRRQGCVEGSQNRRRNVQCLRVSERRLDIDRQIGAPLGHHLVDHRAKPLIDLANDICLDRLQILLRLTELLIGLFLPLLECLGTLAERWAGLFARQRIDSGLDCLGFRLKLVGKRLLTGLQCLSLRSQLGLRCPAGVAIAVDGRAVDDHDGRRGNPLGLGRSGDRNRGCGNGKN
jgi:hypothetical protein